MTSELEEEYKATAIKEMDLALEWQRKLSIADQRFREHISNAEQATKLWTSLIEERTPKLRVVK